MTTFYTDLHCHSTLIPYNLNEDIYFELDPILNTEEFLIDYSESDFNKIAYGNVRLVFLALYPVEQGFFKPKIANSDFFGLLIIQKLLRFFSLNKIYQVRSANHNYFEDLSLEYYYLRNRINNPLIIRSNNGEKKKVTFKLMTCYNDVKQLLNINESTFDATPSEEINIGLILTIEGGHALGSGCEKYKNVDPNNLSDTKTIALLNKLKSNIKLIKGWHAGKHSPLFITFAHHFWNQLCGQSISFAGAINKMLDQKVGTNPNDGITELGKVIIAELLSNANNQKRILIDTKHMSIKTKIWYYDYIKKQAAIGNKIPVISSHSALNGYDTMISSQVNNDTHENADVKYESSSDFNNWDINLSDEEIKIIYDSGGIIGLNFDERILMGKSLNMQCKQANHSDTATRNKVWAIPFAKNIIHIAKVLYAQGITDNSIWEYATVGSDFDGIINPNDAFRTSEDLNILRTSLVDAIKAEMPSNSFMASISDIDIQMIVDNFFTKNVLRFLKRSGY